MVDARDGDEVAWVVVPPIPILVMNVEAGGDEAVMLPVDFSVEALAGGVAPIPVRAQPPFPAEPLNARHRTSPTFRSRMGVKPRP